MKSIEQRVEALEKNARRWRALALVLAAGLAAVIVGAAGPANVPEVVQARKFEVVDAAGKVVARLEPVKDGGSLVLFNNNGTDAVQASASSSGGAVAVHDGPGEPRAVVTIHALSKYAGVDVYDREGTQAVRLSTGYKSDDGLYREKRGVETFPTADEDLNQIRKQLKSP